MLLAAPSSSEDARGLKIHLLGDFQITVNARPIQQHEWRFRRARGLVQLLALSPGYKEDIDKIVDKLWPETEYEPALNRLHRTLHQARHTLEPELENGAASAYLRWEENRLILRSPGTLWVDVTAFKAKCAEARRTRDPDVYTAALDLYTGDLLPHDGYEAWDDSWITSHREELRALHFQIMEELAQVYQARGEMRQVIAVLERLVTHDPLREDAQRELMRLYAVSGQRYLALRHYQRLLEKFQEEEIQPEAATAALYEDIRAERVAMDPRLALRLEITAPQPAPIAALDAAQTNLPTHQTPFIGRRQELEEVQRLLSTSRLLTLTGTGGCGKTRLAEEAARAALAAYPDGVWLVELAAMVDQRLIPSTIAAALGIQEQPGQDPLETLKSALQGKHLLLLLDNCEQLLSACAALAAALLQACPQLAILTTSRHPLRVQRETVWRVPSLRVPDPTHLPPFEALLTFDAIALFLDRANAARPVLPLTSQNATAIVHICHRLDGIPLAIELAARRVNSVSVEQIAARLDDRFVVLEPGNRGLISRHQTLRAAIDWSHDLLTAKEQIVFRRLSVFAGGWMLEEAEQVCAGEPIEPREIVGLLAELVDQSLIVAAPDQEKIRYHFLEVIRQYSAEQCQAADEQERLRERHAACYRQLAETAEPRLTKEDQKVWLERLETEHDNIQAALRWGCAQGVADPALFITAALFHFWHRRSHLSEGLAWHKEALALKVDSSHEARKARAKVLNGAGIFVYLLGDLSQSAAWYEEALALFRSLKEKPGIESVLNNWGMVKQYQGQLEQALAMYQEALAIDREIEDRRRMATTLNNLGTLLKDQGRYREATPLTEESLALFREVGDTSSAAGMLNNVALLLLAQGDFARATALFQESLDRLRQQHNFLGSIEPLYNLGVVAQRQGQYEQALVLLKEALALSEELHDGWSRATILHLLGVCAYGQGAYQRAEELYQESLALQRELEYKQAVATVLVSLGTLRCTQRRLQEARASYEEGLRLFREVHDLAGITTALEGLADLAVEEGDPAQAARLFAAAAVQREATGAVLPLCDRPRYEQQLAQSQVMMGAVAWRQVWEDGQAISLDSLLTELLGAGSSATAAGVSAAAQPDDRQTELLSKRERQIVSLLTEELTNREIAARLAIAPRTVDTHVTNILAKLGLRSRAQVTAWARTHQLNAPEDAAST